MPPNASAPPDERNERCGTCKQVRHPYLFPYLDPAASTYTLPPRSHSPAALAAYEKRVARDNAIRVAAQTKGRDHSKCLLCMSEEGNA